MSFDIWGKRPQNKTGEHFGCNCWSWLPIWALIRIVNKKRRLFTAFDLRLLRQNNNCGLKSRRECDRLVAGLNDLLDSPATMKAEGLIVSGTHIQLPIEWTPEAVTDARGRLLTEKELAARKGDFSGLQSPYRVEIELVRGFIVFLRLCGGFEVG
jgi:hypothetical protein